MSYFLDYFGSESEVGVILSTRPTEKSDPSIIHQKFRMKRLYILVVVRESRTIGEHRDLRLISATRIHLIAALAAREMVGAGDVFKPEP